MFFDCITSREVAHGPKSIPREVGNLSRDQASHPTNSLGILRKKNSVILKKTESEVLSCLKMAAITSNMTIEFLTSAWYRIGNSKAIHMTIAIPSMVMCPIIVFGNLLVILSVWIDPLKKLRSSPSNHIIVSMAIADLLVGSVVCPLMVYWARTISKQQNLTFPALNSFSVLIDISAGHVLLLTVDRVFASVTPLQYRVKVTNRRVCIASITCWAYFILFGCAFGLWEKGYIIMGTIFNVQSFCIVISIFLLNLVILFAFHKHSKTTKAQDYLTENRQIMIHKRETKLYKGIVIVICAFLICFVPWSLVQCLFYFCAPCISSRLMLVHTLTISLLYANSGVNPFLYAWRIPRYRVTLKHFLKKIRQGYCVSENSHDENSTGETRL